MKPILLFILLLLLFLGFALWKKKLTPAGCIAAAVIGVLIFAGFGLVGIAVIGTFFFLAVMATQWGMGRKKKMGAAEKEEGRRDVGQVVANGGVAGLLGLVAWMGATDVDLLFLMLAGALSSATADTLSSELGTLYGKQFINIVDLKPGKKGDNGVISLEGTLIGGLASTAVALIAWYKSRLAADLLLIVIAGTFGNLVDSLLGATLERRGLLSNNTVNFLNTFAAALLTWVLSRIL